MVQERYKIPFVGLKPGSHEFQFEVTETFFETCENSDIEKANCQVTVTIEKQSTMLVLSFEVGGNVEFLCDRCAGSVNLPIQGEYGLIAEFSDVEVQNTEEIVYLSSSEHQLDVENFIYEFVQLSFPVRKLHGDGECDEEMINSLNKYLVTEEPVEQDSEEIEKEDPRWSALKSLLKEK